MADDIKKDGDQGENNIVLPEMNLEEAAKAEEVKKVEEVAKVEPTPSPELAAISQVVNPEPVVSSETPTQEPVVDTPVAQVATAQEPIAEAPKDDPFEGLNIVFDEPKTATDTAQATPTDEVSAAAPETKPADGSFVDPFVAAKASEAVAATDSTQTSLDNVMQTSEENPNQANLDTMVESIQASPAVSTEAPNSEVSKKKKILIMGTAALGLLVLLGVSYFVFSTMFSSSNNQIIENPSDTTGAVDTNSWTAENTNPTTEEDLPNAVPAEETGTNEDELPAWTDDNAQWSSDSNPFGNEDELPAWTIPSETPSANTGSDDEESLPSSVAPEVSNALQTLDSQVDKVKQLLVVAKTKNDTESMKQIATILKTIRTVKTKIETNSFTSFSSEIEPDMSKISFDIDQLTSTLVTN